MNLEDVGVGARVDHAGYGEGIVSEVSLTGVKVIFVRGGEMSFSKNNEDIEVLDAGPAAGGGGGAASDVDLGQLEEVITHVMDKFGMFDAEVQLGDRWEGGTMTLEPGREGLQSKEMPIEAFFHKIVMLRDRLRVLEQNVNSHKSLSDEEKVHLQQYITRCYGSLTSFNLLFADKEHYFKGTGKG